MTARVLVVDDHAPNVKLLESRLGAEYYTVLTASDGPRALAIAETGACDLVLLDIMMPGMDGFEVCRRLKADPRMAHLPVVMVTALDEPADRVRGLEAGADDFLTKPVDEVELVARVRSLVRLKIATDELRERASASATLARTDPIFTATAADGDDGRILVVDDRPAVTDRIVRRLRALHAIEVVSEPQDALIRAAEGAFDLVIVGLGMAQFDALRLVAQIRALERTRTLPILLAAEGEEKARILRGLDLGANDYLSRSLDGSELVARVRTQIRRYRYAQHLRENVQNAIELAGVDALTGLHNRRYFETHFADLLKRTAEKGRPLSLLTLDIDHFKSVNDTWGHDAGDAVLSGFAARVKRVVRTMDLVCRLGGEEFVVVMPDTPGEVAMKVAERLRASVESEVFPLDSAGSRSIHVTVSIGLAERGRTTNPDDLFKAADEALYASKRSGRNRVTAAAA
jgi:two-component system cell cycle response regulator